MSTYTSSLVRSFGAPVAYVIVVAIYWKHALYQGLTALEVTGFLTLAGGVTLLIWIASNKKAKRSHKVILVTSLIVLSLAQVAAYSFVLSIPSGWENL
jgi:hypothetical protein